MERVFLPFTNMPSVALYLVILYLVILYLVILYQYRGVHWDFPFPPQSP